MSDARQVAAEALAAFNDHDEAGIRATYAEDVVFEGPGDARAEGADAATEYAMGWLRAFPDARVEVNSEHIDGEWVVHRITFRGTHEQPLAAPDGTEIPATNRRLEGRAVQIFRVVDGKVAEEHLYYDQMQVMTQLGLVPEAATAV